jgi:hypothetical protein
VEGMLLISQCHAQAAGVSLYIDGQKALEVTQTLIPQLCVCRSICSTTCLDSPQTNVRDFGGHETNV